jgi:hypothetical protein
MAPIFIGNSHDCYITCRVKRFKTFKQFKG